MIEEPQNVIDHFERQIRSLRARVAELESQLNAPEVADFVKGVQLEAAHQRDRWGEEHDLTKRPEDWMWTLAHLAAKVSRALSTAEICEGLANQMPKADPVDPAYERLMATVKEQQRKALHHIISSAALCANWHLYQSRRS